MTLLEELFASGRIADIAILILIVEAAALIVYNARTGRGLETPQILSNAAAGIALFVAVRLALTHAAWPLVALSLGAALVAHLADLKSRWR